METNVNKKTARVTVPRGEAQIFQGAERFSSSKLQTNQTSTECNTRNHKIMIKDCFRFKSRPHLWAAQIYYRVTELNSFIIYNSIYTIYQIYESHLNQYLG